MKRVLPLLFLASLGAVACGPKFEEQSVLASLRVLGVRKDKPYAKPGDTVKLSMLYDDAAGLAADAAPKKRDVLITWISACENPNGDSYLGCVPELAKTFATIANAEPGTDPCIVNGRRVCGLGLEYSFQLSDTIISEHGAPPDKSPHYGLSYVFFLVCAGELKPAPAGQQFPVACYSKSGKQLGADDFVIGYTAVYAYESITNANPVVTGFSVDGKPVTPLCVDEACVTQEAGPGGTVTLDAGRGDASKDAGPDVGTTEGGASSSEAGSREAGASSHEGGAHDAGPVLDPCADPSSQICFDVCTEEKQDDCPEHDVMLEVATASIEHDAVTKAREGRDILEQAWINYYTEQGNFKNDVKLLADATEGLNQGVDRHGNPTPQWSTKLRVPKKLGPFSVWGVAHDSRGGVGWAEVRLATRRPK